jgi:hypothetical protein
VWGELMMVVRALQELMNKKEVIGDVLNQLRLVRERSGDDAALSLGPGGANATISGTLAHLLTVMERLDQEIGD